MFANYLVFIVVVLFTFDSYSQEIEITIETDIYKYAQEILNGKSPLEIDDFSGKNSQRDVVEFILVQKALLLGGAKLDFIFNTGNYDSKNSKLLKEGALLINFDTMWYSHAQTFSQDVYISDPLIRKGEYHAGIYTSENSKLKINNLQEFKKLSVISNRNWSVDWKTLTDISPSKLIHEEEWVSMAKMVSLGWVDVMLAPFNKNKPFFYQGKNYKIYALKGIKISLNDSRHFVVSRNHPLGKKTFIALQKGLKILREQGAIDKAYRQSGFFNDETKNWKVLNK